MTIRLQDPGSVGRQRVNTPDLLQPILGKVTQC